MKGIRLFVVLCALVFTQGRSLAQERNSNHSITNLGTLGGTSSVGCGPNSRGEVVGFSSIATGQTHAFRWSDGEMTDLATLPGFPFSEGRDINKHGQVVGLSRIASGELHAFLWEDGAMTDLNNLIPSGSGWIL